MNPRLVQGAAATWPPRRTRRRSRRGGRRAGRRSGWRHRSGGRAPACPPDRWLPPARLDRSSRRDRTGPGRCTDGVARRTGTHRRRPRLPTPHPARRPARRAAGPGPDPDHQPPRASQRHDLGGHRRPARRGGPGQGRSGRAGGGADRRRRPGLLRRGRPLGHGPARARRRRPTSTLDHHRARGWLAELFEELWHAGQADHRPGPGLGHGRRVRAGPGLRHGHRLGPGPLRGTGAERGAVALHGHRVPCCGRCPRRRRSS